MAPGRKPINLMLVEQPAERHRLVLDLPVYSLPPVCCDKHQDRKQPGEERVYFTLEVTVNGQENQRRKTERQRLKVKKPGRKVACPLSSYMASSLRLPRMALLSVDWGFLQCQLTIKNTPH